MSSVAISDKIQDLIQGMSRYANNDVTKGDYRTLQRVVERFVVVMPATLQRKTAAVSLGERSSRFWTNYIDVFERHYGNGVEVVNLEASREDILSELEKYFTLDELVVESDFQVIFANVVSGGAPRPVFVSNKKTPQWLMCRLTHVTHEKKDVRGGEYPS